METRYFIIVMLFVIIFCKEANSQDKTGTVRDKYTLLTMPYNQRPLYLYKGQLQVNGGYRYSIRSKSFGPDGEKISLKEDGTGSVAHYYLLELKYGITDFLEMKLKTDYTKQGIRGETNMYWTGSSYRITVNDLTEIKGMGDILVQAALRWPLEYKFFDLGIAGGIYLPVAQYENPKPSHTVTDATSANNYTINYHYNIRCGYGVPVYLVSAAGKVTFSKFTLSADYAFSTPVKEGENLRWDQIFQTATKTFSYTSKPYTYLLNTNQNLDITAHFQASGWLDIFINSAIYRSSGGWTEYNTGRYKNPDVSLIAVEPGIELQISPAVIIYQKMSIPLSGKNTAAPFYFLLTASINMFPFLK